MGYTLVAGFDEQSLRVLHGIMEPFRANKIPFGRNCDREAANREMDYHMTLFHWAKAMDNVYLPKLTDFVSVPCQIQVAGIRMMPAEEDSHLLYFDVCSGDGYNELADLVEKQLACRTSVFLHITLAVSKDSEEIQKIYRHICKTVVFPFSLSIDRLDLYHIWKPTQKVRSL